MSVLFVLVALINQTFKGKKSSILEDNRKRKAALYLRAECTLLDNAGAYCPDVF